LKRWKCELSFIVIPKLINRGLIDPNKLTMEYSKFKAEDFVLDESFQKWIMDGDKEANNFWKQWLLQNPSQSDEVEKAKDILMNLALQEKNVEVNIIEGEWNRLMSNPEITGESKFRSLVTSPWMRIAASLLVLIFASAVFYWYNVSQTLRYHTSYGEIKQITLPDQSLITLNGNSTITFKKGWNPDEARIVTLDGEAFFSVTHKSNHQKFIVKTGEIDVTVLGTEFNVNNRRGDIKVVLNSGKVKLTDNNRKELLMKPGELVTYSVKNEKFVKSTVEAAKFDAWKKNILHFENTTLAEIAQILEDNYGLEVIIKDKSVEKRKFTGKYPANNIDILIKALSGVFQLNIHENGNQIIIENKK
jgi:transmembrane sensor